MKKFNLITILLFGLFAGAQQPQTSNPNTSAINAKYVQGVGIGYHPTAGSGLTLNIAAGTVNCGGTIVNYAGGTLLMTASVNNYIYFNTSSSCVPSVELTSFGPTDFPVAIVLAGSSTISTITDVRTLFQLLGLNLTDSKTRQCEMVWGGTGTSNVLQSGDDVIENNGCYNNTGYTETITAVACMVDTTSTSLTVNPTFGTDGTGTTLLSGALQCGNGTAYEYETNTAASITISNGALVTATGIRPVMGGTLTGIHSVHLVFTYTTP